MNRVQILRKRLLLRKREAQKRSVQKPDRHLELNRHRKLTPHELCHHLERRRHRKRSALRERKVQNKSHMEGDEKS